MTEFSAGLIPLLLVGVFASTKWFNPFVREKATVSVEREYYTCYCLHLLIMCMMRLFHSLQRLNPLVVPPPEMAMYLKEQVRRKTKGRNKGFLQLRGVPKGVGQKELWLLLP